MDRETRKANLKKLQLPGSSLNKQRKTRQTAKSTTTSNSTISKFFLTPGKQNKDLEELNNVVETVSEETSNKERIKVPHSPDVKTNTAARSRAKRTKLDAFIFKDPITIPDSIKQIRNSLNDEDLVVLEEKVKKAPKLSQRKEKSSKSSKSRKQTSIKTAFLRNEQLFAEIAAQHCAADHFDGDDVQLALAISKSEAESKGIQITDNNVNDGETNVVNIDDEAESIRKKLEKYGFRTAEKKDYNTFAAAFLPKLNSRRPKSKWANKFTALTLRSSENQLKKLQENIEKIIKSQFCTKPLKEQEQVPPLYKLQSSLLKKSEVHVDKRILQNSEYFNRPNDLFFVSELFEINQLPAGNLLRDWSAIQGRDQTPNTKDKQNTERLNILETIYQDLEEFFSSRKRLDWTSTSDIKEDQRVAANKEKSPQKESQAIERSFSNSLKIVKGTENEELNGIIELIENQQRNEECDKENIDTDTTTSASDDNILRLLPTSKNLDVMQVSTCSINTQATINTTWKNRSNSPDLFADSDVEMEEIDDNGKNRDLLPKSTLQYKACDVIDLTQDDLQLSNISNNATYHLNQSKPIVEIDLFVESPLQDDNSDLADSNRNSQQTTFLQVDKKENFMSTFSLELEDKQEQFLEKKTEETFKLSPTVKTQKLFKKNHKHIKDEDKVLREMIMDQTDISFLNFEGFKQLETSFHKKTAPIENDIIKYHLSGNDTIFRELCNKYLNQGTANKSTVKEQEKADLNDISEQVTPTIKTSPQCQNLTNFTMDFDMTVKNNLTLKRKSISFTAKTPLKQDLKETKTNVSKSQSFNNLNSDISIDLTKNNENENNSDDEEEAPEVGEEDDCLILSDDEINYSIWQANKTLNLKTSDQENNISIPSNISSSDEDHKISHQENIIEFPYNKENEKEYTYLDLEEKEKSFIKINLGPEDAFETDFEILKSKYATSHSGGQEKMEFDRSEFGILKEYFEPIDITTNLCTPTKVLAEASFLCSPTETAAPMKCFSHYSKSSQKFQNLLDDVQANSPTRVVPEFDDYEELDFLLCKSPLKTVNPPKKPQDIDRLLTAEICFKESQETAVASKKLRQEEMEIHRSEFGILEEYFEPIDITKNLCTPTKVLAEATFLCSPTETAAPMKPFSHYSKSSQKFKNLLDDVQANSPTRVVPEFDDCEELDFLLCKSPLKTFNPPKKIQDIDRLLTAEISFKESQETAVASKKLPSETHEVEFNNKTYTVRYTNSPKPDYTTYSEAELLKELYNYGIKPLKRKQAVKMLEYIYNQTHPIFMEEEDDTDLVHNQKDVITLDDFELPSTSKEALKINKSVPKSDELNLMAFTNDNAKEIAVDSTKTSSKTLNLQDSCGLEMLRYSNDLKAELRDEIYILQTNVTKKTPQPLLPFHIAWYNLVCSNRKLHETILMYEPIDLQEIYLFLKTLGYRYDPKDLKTFFDRRCIIFRYDLASAAGGNRKIKNANRHVRKSTKSKTTITKS